MFNTHAEYYKINLKKPLISYQQEIVGDSFFGVPCIYWHPFGCSNLVDQKGSWVYRVPSLVTCQPSERQQSVPNYINLALFDQCQPSYGCWNEFVPSVL